MDRLVFTFHLALPTRYPFVNELRGRRTIADDDEDRRHRNARPLPFLEFSLVVVVEGIERRLQNARKLKRIEIAGLPRAFFGKLVRPTLDVLPKITEHRHVGIDRIVRYRDARELDDAAFDRIDQGEVGDHPGKERALFIARAAQEERRGGKIIDRAYAHLALQGLDTGNPQPCRLVVLFRLLPILCCKPLFFTVACFFAIAVMRLVVDNNDILHAEQIFARALQHFAFGFFGNQFFVAPPGQNRFANLIRIEPPAPTQSMKIGDDDLRLAHLGQHLLRHEMAACVVTLRIGR